MNPGRSNRLEDKYLKKFLPFQSPFYTGDSEDTQSIPDVDDILKMPISSVFLSSVSGILISNSNHQFICANKVLYDGFNGIWPGVKIIGRHWYEAFHFIRPYILNAEKLLQKQEDLIIHHREYLGQELALRNGRILSVNFIPVFSRGKFRGSIWQFIDITRQRAVHEEIKRNEEKFRGMLDNLQVGYSEVDLEGRITKISDGLCRMSGYTSEELIGKNIIDTFLPATHQESEIGVNEPQTGTGQVPFLDEREVIMKNGMHKWVLTSSSNLYDMDGTLVGVVGVHMDITGQKTLQSNLEKSIQKAEQSQIALEQFLASMSHEIRTPLNAIIGMTHLLGDTKLNSAQKEYVQILRNSSNILHGLISDILDFSKIESGNMEIHHREFDLVDLVNTLIETFRYKLKRKPVDIHFTIDKRISNYLMGDDILLNQVLLNLLGNAEKFTRRGEIFVKMQRTKEAGDKIWVEFKVGDTGIGIEEDKLMVVFQDFRQANKAIRGQYGGTGLGLSISKKLIELQGGTIYVESTLGQGTCFTFTLPFQDTGRPVENKENKHLSTLTSTSPTELFEGSRLLIVEDNLMNLKYLTSLLERMKIQFDVATNGVDALELTRQQIFHLILMDMKIPGIEGMELARIIRGEGNQNNATPIIIITAAALQSTVQFARENGINELLTKPYTPDQLLTLLRKYLTEDEPDKDSTGLSIISRNYEFNHRLDDSYLNELYEQNVDYAIGLFTIFIDNIDQEWKEIGKATDDGNIELVRQLVHKIKPNFSMVGLTWISKKMEKIERGIKDNTDFSLIPSLLEETSQELSIYLPVVRNELEQMQEFIKRQGKNPQNGLSVSFIADK
ncbi:MAG TPA: ATP-binding protein [Chitinophagaceae bacterium]|nr:ATP-binding protein [Chitinophagaceae bacterium]